MAKYLGILFTEASVTFAAMEFMFHEQYIPATITAAFALAGIILTLLSEK